MLIPRISQVDERARNTSRWVAAVRANRPPPSAPAPAPAEVMAGEEGEADDASAWAPQRGMTLAAAREAYASN
jgi:hypothetical protein